MKRFILLGTLVLSAVAASLSYNRKNETGISELVEANIEALCLETQDVQPCIRREQKKCTEWFVISDGATGVVNYPDYINYMEVEVDE
ncbi:MAG: hypothetical protein IKH95_01365 [Bacteroidaceae bacterium]|nr:hypothetical protein [Bacteroidaceae bacterium]